jgi:hypothetical protein
MSNTINQSQLIATFDRLAPVLSNDVGGPVHLVRVIGTRWSYVAGHVPDELPFVEPQKVMIDDEWAIVYYQQEGRTISPEQVRQLFVDAKESDHDAG